MGVERNQKPSTFAVLIIARPGRLRDGLQALVRTMPQVHTVMPADDEPGALQILAQLNPALILLDSDAADSFADLLAQLHTAGAAAKTIVLTNGEPQADRALQAGADAVLTKGFPLHALNRKVTDLLHPA